MKNLEQLVNQFGIVKEKVKTLKTEEDNLNKQIKSIMLAGGLNTFETTDWKVNYQVRKSESLDEDKVLQILHNNNIEGIIKTKEYVDEDALEKAIFNGELSQSVLQEIAACKITKETVALTIKER